MPLNIQHETDSHQFSVEIGGKKAVLQYRKLSDQSLEYYRTYVPPELRHQNIAAELVEAALHYAKENNLKVKPSCSYVQWYFEQHPEHQGLRI